MVDCLSANPPYGLPSTVTLGKVAVPKADCGSTAADFSSVTVLPLLKR
ncbi:hypothetical protein NP603_17550 [Methylomonas sp. SURF-1]|uniref:Uncharacterized protein n=1 Tax=Methylomonas aurea TaxID=2952224 RepID=A0ABT1UL24_9GAMM|nr:hypothetical protein [Methylomonas sp. SURF-1]MCQ8182933.1 hypothetical protein [Methylomonas sp. SURF-1]